MRPMLATVAFVLIVALSAMASVPTPQAVSSVATSLEGSSPEGDRWMGAPEIDFLKWGFTQGGLAIVLLVVLAAYRRDFFRKQEMTDATIRVIQEEKRVLVAVLEKNADAMIDQAVAVEANTKATELLAQNVNNLSERRHRERE